MLYALYSLRQKVYPLHATLLNVPKLPSVVETQFISPYTDHPPQGDQDGSDVGDYKLNFP